MKVSTSPPPPSMEQQIRDHQAKVAEEQSQEKGQVQRRDQVNLSAESLRLADEAVRDTAEKQRGSNDPSLMS